MELLQSENLFDRILEDFDHCGIVGEQQGKLIGYLAATSRLLAKPLGLIVQSSSAAGKSSLTGAVLRFMPDEALVECSAMTSQSLYYLGQQDLQHRILSIAEEEGIRDASYGLKLLQSEGRLSLISTTREKGTGRLVTQRYEVDGPVALMLTTTAADLDPELHESLPGHHGRRIGATDGTPSLLSSALPARFPAFSRSGKRRPLLACIRTPNVC